MKTRLEQMIEVFGWQGGTIHQVNREVELCLGYPFGTLNILCMADEEFWDIQADVIAAKLEELV